MHQFQETIQVPFIGTSAIAEQVRDFIIRAAETRSTILLRGETGTGKDLVAEAIHATGGNNGRPFVPLDCGALSEHVLESELFGHVKGAFTGAIAEKRGLVEVAEGGTLFVNEVANMSPTLQAKFLRVLEGKSFRRVGGIREITPNTRIIAATHANLEAAVRDEKFREDLYFRMKVISFAIAPLRDRPEDIPALAVHFLRRTSDSKSFSGEAMTAMTGYHWPGNVRELSNAVEAAVFSSRESPSIEVQDVKPHLNSAPTQSDGHPVTFKEFERKYFLDLLKASGGNGTHAAKKAGFSARNIRNKIKEFGLRDFVDALRKEQRQQK